MNTCMHHSVQNSTPPCLFQTQWHLHIPPTIPSRNSCTILTVCIEDVSKMLGQNSGVISPRQNKEKISYQYMSASRFRGTVQQRVDLKPLDFYIWGNLQHPSVFSCNWKWRNTLSAYFVCLWNHSQPTRDLGKGVLVHDQTWPWVHWFWCRTFSILT